MFTKAPLTRFILLHEVLIPSSKKVLINTKLATAAKATAVMNSKTLVHLLLVFSLFASCLPVPGRHFLVETEDGAEGKNEDVGEEADLEPDLDELELDEQDEPNADDDPEKIAEAVATLWRRR